MVVCLSCREQTCLVVGLFGCLWMALIYAFGGYVAHGMPVYTLVYGVGCMVACYSLWYLVDDDGLHAFVVLVGLFVCSVIVVVFGIDCIFMLLG